MHLLSNVCVLTKYSQAIEIENFAVPVLMVADLRVGLLGGQHKLYYGIFTSPLRLQRMESTRLVMG